MKLDLIAQLLADAGLGTIGVDIFAHSMPADCEKGIMLRNPLDGVPVNAYLPGYYRTKLQAIVRAPTFAEGDELSKRAGALLKMFNRRFTDQAGNLVLKVNHIYPEKLPINYPRSPGQGIEFSLNFHACYVMP